MLGEKSITGMVNCVLVLKAQILKQTFYELQVFILMGKEQSI